MSHLSSSSDDSVTLSVAYLIPIYPMNSQSFVRREIAEVEARGVAVQRHSIRRWDETPVDPLDQAESRRTRVILDAGVSGMLTALFLTALRQPRRFARTLGLAIWFGARAGTASQGILRHLIFLAESCVLLGWFRRDPVDHLHCHFGTNSTVVGLLCHELGGPPFSFTVHGPEEFDKPLGLGLDEKVRRSAFVVAISDYGRSQLRRWVTYEHWPKIQVVRCGVDAMFLETDVAPMPAARQLLCVGRLAEQKGHLTLIEAAAQLRRQRVDFELVLVGDGPLRGEIERLIAEHDLRDHVRLVGWQSNGNVRQLMEQSRATVLSSFAEGLPVVIMESLALHRPVISTYVAAIPELIRPGETGWLVPASSADLLSSAMRDALDAPPERLERMGRAGAALVEKRHSATTEAARLVELFHQGDRGEHGGPDPSRSTERRFGGEAVNVAS